MHHYTQAYDVRYRQVHELGMAWSSMEPTPVLADVISRFGLRPEARMLEIGCGEGRDAARLLSEGFSLLATDLSPEAVSWCRKTFPDWGDSFQILDCLSGSLEEKFHLIYAVAVLHMLVEDADRQKFYRFFREHLAQEGIGLICTMGDGEMEFSSDISAAFALQQRTHQETGKQVAVAATSCRVVAADTFRRELEENGLSILELGMTASPPDFSHLIYGVVRNNE